MPEEGQGALLAGVRRRARPDALRCSTACSRPRTATTARWRCAARAVPRSAAPAGEDQRPVDARLPDSDRRSARERQPPHSRRRDEPDRGRADGQHAGDQGPRAGHGVHPLDQDPPRHPVAARRRRSSGARADRAARVDGRHHQTIACIQCGACVSACLSMEVDPEFIGLRRSPRPTGSWATRATSRPGSASTTSRRTRTGSTTAPTASPASTPAPRASRRWTRSCACAAAPPTTRTSTTATTAATTSARS